MASEITKKKRIDDLEASLPVLEKALHPDAKDAMLEGAEEM